MLKRLVVLLSLAVACSGARPPAPTPSPALAAGAVEPQGTPLPPTKGIPGERGSLALSADTRPRDQAMLGDFVRARTAQLNFWYTEALANKPGLAGSVAVAVTITGQGDVTDVRVIKRSWDGPAAVALEDCIGARIRSWKFPRADAPVGTYPFSLSFTK